MKRFCRSAGRLERCRRPFAAHCGCAIAVAFPGCTHHRHVDAHHIRHWADGGETRLSNLVELCGRHHRLLHEGGYGLRATDDGALVFTRPDGKRIPAVPRTLLLASDPVAVLEHDHRRLGVSAETHSCHGDGARPDCSTAIEILDAKERKPRGDEYHDDDDDKERACS